MKTKQKHLAILISFFVASSIAAPITNPQAAQPAVLPQSAQANSDQLILVAVLKVNAALRAKDFARRSDANLPSVLRGAKVRPALTLAFSAANERLPETHPSQMLRRTVLADLRLGNRSIEAIRADLLATNLFESVQLAPKPASTVAFSALDELSNPAGLSDNARKQWALPTIKSEQAWGFTNGRANIGSLEGGIQSSHPDLAANLLPQSSALPAINTVVGISDWEPQSLGTVLPPNYDPISNGFIAHGMNVNSLMAGAWQSKSSATPLSNSGVVGTCPSCKFATIRLIASQAAEDAFPWFSKNSGITAINMSFGASDSTLFPSFLNDALQRDVVLVSAAGNGNVDAANPAPSQYPSSHPGVISVGASDFQDKRWDERRIAQLPNISLRHAGIGDRYILDYRCKITEPVANFGTFPWARECGSSNDVRVDLYAPGVQMIGATDRLYIAEGLLKRSRELNNNSNVWPDSNPNHFASMGLGIGNSGNARIGTSGIPAANTGINTLDTNGNAAGIIDPTDPAGYPRVGVVPIIQSGFGSLNYTQWGPMTGTSMATPMVTGTVGLMRSINPMVSVASVRALLKSSAMDTITEHQFNLPPPAEPPQYKRLNMENAVKSTLASVRGVQQVNRLIPMFSMRSIESQQFIRDVKGGQEAAWEKDEPASVSAIDSWLFTTSTQVATAAITGDLAYTGFQDTNDDFGTDQRTQFKAGATYGTGGALPSYRFTQWGAASSSDQLPTASFYLFSTETKPAGLPAAAQLIPLWRLSTRCFEIRKYSYSTNAAERTSFTSNGTNIGDTVATCIPDATRQYWEEGIEGYVLSEQVPGTVPLYRVARFTGATSTVALSTKSPDDNAAFSGLSDFAGPANNALLGYVYPTEVAVGSSPRTLRDTDSDGLEDQFERVTGLNEQTANSDCDGSPDGVEFPIAGISPSDPNFSASCADRRANVVRQSAATVEVIMSNAGVSSANNVMYEVIASVPVGNTFPAVTSITVPSECVEILVRAAGEWAVYHCTYSTMPSGFSSKVVFKMVAGATPAVVANFSGTVTSLGTPSSDPAPNNNTQTTSFSF